MVFVLCVERACVGVFMCLPVSACLPPGACHSHGEYFSADRQRYGCGNYINICRNGRCIKAYVVDYGPSCFVENDAGGPVLDASPAICSGLTGGR